MRLRLISWNRQTQCVQIFLSSFTHHYFFLVAWLSDKGILLSSQVCTFVFMSTELNRINPVVLEVPAHAGRNCCHAAPISPSPTSKCQHGSLCHDLLTQIFCKTFRQPIFPVLKTFQNQIPDMTIRRLILAQSRGWPGLELTLLGEGRQWCQSLN